MFRNLIGLLPILTCLASAAAAQSWSIQTRGLDTNLRAVGVARNSASRRQLVVWAAGSKGVVLRSDDLGKTWQRIRIRGADALDFRGVAAIDGKTAYVMSIGNAGKSRIYKTLDAGSTWTLQYNDSRTSFFLDAISCVSATHCVAIGDPIDGKFLILATRDGEHWSELSSAPPALPKEGSFAASNSCLTVRDRDVYFATGGPAARVFHSPDSGRTWTVSATPIASGNESSGIFSLSVRGQTLIAIGGDYRQPNRIYHAAAYSRDGGKTWHLSTRPPGGFRSGVTIVDGMTVAVGPNGDDISTDGGVHWQHTDSLNLNALVILDRQHGWAVGPHGTIARFVDRVNH
jgi:photosystem II stability/assembly factor-like uncharacterized protein